MDFGLPLDRKLSIMLIDKSHILLFIEPLNRRASSPILDDLTYKILYLRRNHTEKGIVVPDGKFVPDIYTMGVHHCTGCREEQVHSHSYDILLSSGHSTNTLAAHYVAYHRDEIPQSEIEKIKSIDVNVSSTDVPNIRDEEFGLFYESESKQEDKKTYTMEELFTIIN